MGITSFEDLDVWRKAHSFESGVQRITAGFPRDEKFELTSQMRRAARSIAANIAEGFGRWHPRDKIRLYHFSRGSVAELRHHLAFARDAGPVSIDTAGTLLRLVDDVGAMLNRLIAATRKGRWHLKE